MQSAEKKTFSDILNDGTFFSGQILSSMILWARNESMKVSQNTFPLSKSKHKALNSENFSEHLVF